MPPSLKIVPLRFEFRAVDTIRIPKGKAGNVFRGAFGTVLRQLACDPSCAGPSKCMRAPECAYAALFEPRQRTGPSGFASPPRPFAIRAAGIDGGVFRPGERFSVEVHLFGDPVREAADWIGRVFEALAESGMGAGRGRAENTGRFDGLPVVVSIGDRPTKAHRFAIDFLTPTDLKAEGSSHHGADFQVVFARARDRLATLMTLYGTGAPDVDYRGIGDAAQSIRTIATDLRRIDAARRSSRTGQTHEIGGFIGRAEYEGSPGPFLPWLQAAFWTGIGRHTAWGNGVIRFTEYS